jgi:hypothetical protein
MRKPDFIIIGAMKSATSTLHVQLSDQPGIFMSEPKEPNFFSDDDQFEKGVGYYTGLFDNAEPGDICGESSTHYTKLPDYPDTIKRMKAVLDSPKLIYVMRHPVERLISHYIHQWSRSVIKCDIIKAIHTYPELVNYSCYAQQLKPYLNEFGRENILLVFQEAFRADPERQLQRIADFIGYPGPVSWHHAAGDQNISSQRIRKFPGYSLIVDSTPMRRLRRKCVPQAFRDRVKKSLTINQRPVIDTDTLKYLADRFDQDLLILGQWLGIELKCNNFTQLVATTELSWRA